MSQPIPGAPPTTYPEQSQSGLVILGVVGVFAFPPLAPYVWFV